MPFDYYGNLTPKQRKTYRESDHIAHVELGDPTQLRGAVTALRDALSAGDRSRVQRACVAVAHGVCDDLVEVWMRTAKRGQVVAFKTLLRTLVHELCHHLDYELHGLDNTFHTEGFFRRESSIMRQLVDLTADLESEPEPEPDPEQESKGQLGFDY